MKKFDQKMVSQKRWSKVDQKLCPKNTLKPPIQLRWAVKTEKSDQKSDQILIKNYVPKHVETTDSAALGC